MAKTVDSKSLALRNSNSFSGHKTQLNKNILGTRGTSLDLRVCSRRRLLLLNGKKKLKRKTRQDTKIRHLF